MVVVINSKGRLSRDLLTRTNDETVSRASASFGEGWCNKAKQVLMLVSQCQRQCQKNFGDGAHSDDQCSPNKIDAKWASSSLEEKDSRKKFVVQWIQNVGHVERELEGGRQQMTGGESGRWFDEALGVWSRCVGERLQLQYLPTNQVLSFWGGVAWRTTSFRIISSVQHSGM